MLAALSSSERWDRSSAYEKEQTSSLVEKALAPVLQFERLETHSLGDQEHIVACFASDNTRFALIPGYSGTLGYDLSIHPLPDDLLEDTNHADTDVAATRDLPMLFRKVLTPLRQVTIRPYMIATTSVPLRTYEQGVGGRWIGGGGPIRRLEVLADVSQAGYRFPTSDEWEYACSGGSRAFFRWGNNWPPIRWVPPTRRAPGDWREDVMPNAFGLLIGLDPQHVEYCAEPDIVRGGDGGTSLSVRVGLREEWLSFATSYRYPFGADFIGRLRNPYLRRALSLPDSLVL